VDIEGYEVEFLVGARETLNKGMADYLFVSTHSQVLHQRIMSELVEFGYRVDVSSDVDSETTSHDGFVFASSPQAKKIFSKFPNIGRALITASRSDQLLQAILNARNSTL
jgi:hypothetical protein